MKSLMRRGLIAAGLAVILLWVTPSTKAEIDSNYIDQGGVRYYIQTDKDVYNLGENVNILYKVSNLTDLSVNLGTVSGDSLAHYDFWVNQGENQIWRYPYISYELTIEDFILPPYQTKEFQTNWNLINDNGTRGFPNDDFLVNPGIYKVLGDVYLFPSSERIPVSVYIDVVPEPATILLLGTGLLGLLTRGIRRQ